MRQVIQKLADGKLKLIEAPDPIAPPGRIVVANVCSLISAGTEKMAIELARKSIVGKAKDRPDAVRRVLEKLRNEGFFSTLEQVLAKLDEPMAMGYSSAGVVLACGAGVQEFKPGDRVATNGPHASMVCVPRHLAAAVPANVSFDQACFAVLGAIALQGTRLAGLKLSETAFVIGLGLVGQITVALLRAAGVRALGTDPAADKCALALRMGAEVAKPGLTAAEVAQLTRGLGADAVIIAASTASDAPVALAGEAARMKGKVVAVGAVGMSLPRRTYYFKELEFVVSCSYGPGRYDPFYEDAGHDYPPAYVRWTEQRNLQAVLELLGAGRLDFGPLISHRFKLDDALRAYELIERGGEPYVGIVLEHPELEAAPPVRVIEFKSAPAPGKIGVGCLGAGGFARATLLPALRAEPSFRLRALASAGGLSAASSGQKLGFERAVSGEDELFKDPEVRAVFVITRHDLHAAQAIAALRAGKHVFVEKPLALDVEELAGLEAALSELGAAAPLLMVGFNRRFSPAARLVKEFFSATQAPLTITARMNAGAIPPDHWTQDELAGGGRIVGEACHLIDLAAFLAGAPPVRVFAESIGGPSAPGVTDDQCLITLRHANGSISSVAYLAGGDRAMPKERVEVYGGGRVAVIDDFKNVTLCAGGKIETVRGWKQDKGHREEIKAFAGAIRAGGPSPISWVELKAVSLASILAVRSMREGGPFETP